MRNISIPGVFISSLSLTCFLWEIRKNEFLFVPNVTAEDKFIGVLDANSDSIRKFGFQVKKQGIFLTTKICSSVVYIKAASAFLFSSERKTTSYFVDIDEEILFTET